MAGIRTGHHHLGEGYAVEDTRRDNPETSQPKPKSLGPGHGVSFLETRTSLFPLKVASSD